MIPHPLPKGWWVTVCMLTHTPRLLYMCLSVTGIVSILNLQLCSRGLVTPSISFGACINAIYRICSLLSNQIIQEWKTEHFCAISCQIWWRICCKCHDNFMEIYCYTWFLVLLATMVVYILRRKCLFAEALLRFLAYMQEVQYFL